MEEEWKELVNDIQRLARLGVRLMILSDSGVKVQNRAESSLVVELRKSMTVTLLCLNLRVQSII